MSLLYGSSVGSAPRVQDAPCRETTTATAIRRDLEAAAAAAAHGAAVRHAREAVRRLTGTAPARARTTTAQGGTATRVAAAAAVRPAETRTMTATMTETGVRNVTPYPCPCPPQTDMLTRTPLSCVLLVDSRALCIRLGAHSRSFAPIEVR